VKHSQTYYDLLDVFKEASGCPICHLTLQGVQAYLESLNYEYVNDPGFRAEIESAIGFCPNHADEWLHTAHVLGTALIYQAVLKRVSHDLEHLPVGRRSGGIWARFVSAVTPTREGVSNCSIVAPAKPCPACLRRAELESMFLTVLLQGLEDPPFGAAYQRSSLLCLPHLRQALCLAEKDITFAVLRDAACERSAMLESQLAEVIRKHDYRFHDEPVGVEHDAVARSVRYIAGAPGIDHR
jgi:hypothetical protein